MARAGFAGSLVVSAGWKGRNLNKGLRDSKKRVNDFGRSLRRTVGGLALGLGAFKAGTALPSLIGWSKESAKALFDLKLKWREIQIAIVDAVDGPLARFLVLLTDGLDVVTKLVTVLSRLKLPTPEWVEKLAFMFARMGYSAGLPGFTVSRPNGSKSGLINQAIESLGRGEGSP